MRQKSIKNIFQNLSQHSEKVLDKREKFVYNSRPNSEERLRDCFEEEFFKRSGL
jgi:hypothetical protein